MRDINAGISCKQCLEFTKFCYTKKPLYIVFSILITNNISYSKTNQKSSLFNRFWLNYKNNVTCAPDMENIHSLSTLLCNKAF